MKHKHKGSIVRIAYGEVLPYITRKIVSDLWILVFISLVCLSIKSSGQTTWYKYPANPVIRSGEHGDWDSYFSVASVLFDSNKYKMWYVGLPSRSFNTGKLGYAVSDDGLDWKKYDKNPLTFECDTIPWDSSLISIEVRRVDSGYVMWYSGEINGEAHIGRAWSENGIKWIKDPEYVLEPGKEGEWDEYGVLLASIIIDNGKYKMWYLGSDNGFPATYRYGYAESADGIVWEKHPANPVIDVGPAGSWDDGRFDSFTVRKKGQLYEMWYHGYDFISGHIGYASSPDGINWTKHPDNPILCVGELGSWDSWLVYPLEVLVAGSEYKMYYLGYTGSWEQSYGYATTSSQEADIWKTLHIEHPEKEVSISVFGQTEYIKIDSILDVISVLNERDRIGAYNELALAYSITDELKSFQYADEAFELADKYNNPAGKAMALYSKGNAKYVLGDYSAALQNHLSALWLFDSLEMVKEQADLMAQIADIHRFTGSYEIALRYFKLAMDIYNDLDMERAVLDIFSSIGHSSLEAGDTSEAIKMFYDKLAMANENNWFRSRAYSNLELGKCYSGNNLDSAIFYLNKAQKAFDTTHVSSAGSTLLNTAIAYYLNGPSTYNLAEEYFLKAYKIYKHDCREDRVRFAYYNAEFYFTLGNYEQAREFLDIALDMCRNFLLRHDHLMYTTISLKLQQEVYLNTYMEKIYRLYYKLDAAQGNETSAFKHYRLATQWKDSIYNEQNKRQIAMMQGRYETESAQNHISMLQKENEVKDLRLQQSTILLFSMGGFILLVILMAILFIRQNKIRTEHKAVMLEQKLLRLQMNPHFIFNALSNILNLINRNSNEIAAKYLTRFSKLLRNTLEGSRQELIHLDKEIEGLENYLELQKLRFKDKFDYHIHVDDSIDTESTLIPPLLVQPFIENAIEHGIRHMESKGTIHLRFLDKEKQLICEIEDDGIGREKAWKLEYSSHKDHESLATTIINERIASLNRNLKDKIRIKIIDLKSEDDEAIGTKVVIALPA